MTDYQEGQTITTTDGRQGTLHAWVWLKGGRVGLVILLADGTLVRQLG